MKFKNILIVPIILLVFVKSFAQEKDSIQDKSWYTPDYVKMQFAGNIGFLSVGAGYQLFNDVLYTELLYGFVPKSISRSENIHLITLKNTFPLYRKKIGKDLTLIPIAGIAVTYDVGSTTFTTLPDKFPEGYYFPTAFHATLYAGAMVHQDFKNKSIFKGADFYLEVGTIESYLWYAVVNESVTFKNVFSTSVGVNFYL